MKPIVRIEPGLPPYGPLAVGFPAQWGALGREGFVVAFETDAGAWTGNFERGLGLGALCFADVHPNGRDAVVIADGDLWEVEVDAQRARRLLPAVDWMQAVDAPAGWVFSRQGLALARLGPSGLLWHTRRLSWDGFGELRIDGDTVRGVAWDAVNDQWPEFSVDLASGAACGGGYDIEDTEGWELLARA